ncbi:MAG: amino acid ABC transporter substrate-binding protein [Proteobacteria bacterium]|nr:amino acid ABC transporter substrate-binding protein [Pseudomonadota bacterium]
MAAITVITVFSGLSNSAQAQKSKDTITIGAALSMTGINGVNGKHTRRGYELAKSLINENGGVSVGGTKFELAIKYYDDESNPVLARKLAKRLITKDKVRLMLGPYSTSTTATVAEVTEKYKVPMVQANGASLSLFDKGYKYMFAVLSSADRYLGNALNLAAEQSKKSGVDSSTLKVAIAVEDDSFSSDLRKGVLADAKKFNMTVVIDEKLPRDFGDMTFILDKVKFEKPDILIVSGHDKGADLAIRQIKEQKVDVPMLAMTHCEGADIHGKYGLGANYTLCSTQWANTMKHKGRWFGTADNYHRQFTAEYGYEPPYQAAESSAAVLVMADAIERAASLDKQKIREALVKTDLKTFFGWVKFDETGKNIAKPMVLRQLFQGKYLTVAPSGFAQHEVVYPRPKWSDR